MWPPQLRPWLLMSFSTFYAGVTIFKLLAAFRFGPLLSWSSFKEEWWGNFWAFMGPRSKADAEGVVEPLLDGRVRRGQILQERVCHSIEGTVLEIGAGNGMWTDVLAKVVRRTPAHSGNATKIYGVEPNPISAAALKKKINDVGLADIYDVVPVGIEDLENADAWGGRIEPGSVDCIVTVHCLCSIPEPEKNVALLYKYLKEGGRWYVFEHVKNDHGWFIPLFQRFTNVFWEHLMGSCHLCRRTNQIILNTGTWSEVDLAAPAGESLFEMIPHYVGILTK
ncbi:Methyltransferase-like protein 7B [Paramyrothecium foliicola]|nr:Methyltransferase-like protein 7B [Paramyrothecium foliicola]